MVDSILEMRNITKRFPGVKALDQVNFSVGRAEIHCLIGENGAGKSTLMKVLSGVWPYGTYEGDVVVDGRVQHFRGIADSEGEGVAIIYQELALIPELSIYENIFFGHEKRRGWSIDWNETIVEAEKLMRRVGLTMESSTKIRELGVGQQQLVEIAKALGKKAKVIIFDEPTAALNEDDSENLLRLMLELKESGVSCIMISHKLKEVRAVADKITVLRDGSTICTIDCREKMPTEAEIIRNMVGREMNDIYPKRHGQKFGDVCFEIRDWTVEDLRKERIILDHVNMSVRRGEIVGLQGLMGAGRTELAMSIFGNIPGYRVRSGQILMNGEPVDTQALKTVIGSGIAYVSEDRKGNGLVLMQDVKYNTTIVDIGKLRGSNVGGLLTKLSINKNEEIKVAEEFRKSLTIKTPSVEQAVGNLSGGNQQKVQLAKWLFVEPKLLILDEPTRGIDVGAKHEIYSLMNRLVVEDGMSIIMISSELPEVMGMSDRIYVMSQGVITGEFDIGDVTEDMIMKHAIKGKENDQ